MQSFYNIIYIRHTPTSHLMSAPLIYEILPFFMLDVTGPALVMNGVPLNVARPLSSTNSSSATFVNALLALFPGGSGSGLCPTNVTSSPILLPSGTNNGSTADLTSPSLLLAHKSIPNDVMPLRGLGFRLHNTTTFLFNNSSAVQYATSPLTIVLGPSASPTSTFSTYNESASGCLEISTILPIRISNRESSVTSATGPAFASVAHCLRSKRFLLLRDNNDDPGFSNERHDPKNMNTNARINNCLDMLLIINFESYERLFWCIILTSRLII